MTPAEADSLIRSTYRQYLGRDPSQKEIEIHRGWKGSTQDWVRSIQNSPEAKAYANRNAPKPAAPQPGAPAGPAPTGTPAQIITQVFQQYLGRTPSAGEIQYHTTKWPNVATFVSAVQATDEAKRYAASKGPAAPGAPPSAPGINYANYAPYDAQRIQALQREFPNISPQVIEYHYQTMRHDPAREGEVRSILSQIYNAQGGLNFQTPVPKGAVAGDADPGRALREAVQGEARTQAKIIPGAAPNLGVLADGTVVDLITGDKAQVDALTQAFAKMAAGNRNVPKWAAVNQGTKLSSRGYQFRGEPSAQEKDLEARFLAGDPAAGNALARLRMQRIEQTPRDNPTLDKAMKSLAISMIAMGMGAALGPGIGALLGPGLGGGAAAGGGAAGFGGAATAGGTTAAGLGTAGLSTGLAGGLGSAIGSSVGSGLGATLASHGDPKAALIGAITGGLGSAAGSAAGSLVSPGLKGVVGGAAGGAAGSGAKVALTEALGGEANPWDVLTSTLAGGVAGGATQAIGGLLPKGEAGKKLAQLAGSQTGSNMAQFLRSILPIGDPSHFTPGAGPSPFPKGETMQRFAAAAQKDYLAMQEAAMKKGMSEYEAKKAAYEAAKAEWMAKRDAAMAEYKGRFEEAMAAHGAKLAEYQAKVTAAQTARDEARAKLKSQAIARLQEAMRARGRPLPPIPPINIPVKPGPVPVDPFAPDKPLSTDPFAPATPAPKYAGDFPVAQQGQPAAPTATSNAGRGRPSVKQLPLNIQQIQAALSARRRV